MNETWANFAKFFPHTSDLGLQIMVSLHHFQFFQILHRDYEELACKLMNISRNYLFRNLAFLSPSLQQQHFGVSELSVKT